MASDEHDEVRGVLPLVLLSSRLFGRFLVSMPFFNYGGVLADTLEAQEALLEAAIGLAKELDVAFIELRHQESLGLKWPSKQHKVSMRLDLPTDFETLWKGFPSKLRSQIRRAQKEAMTVRIASQELLDDFYQLFARNMRDLGTPVYGRRFFEASWMHKYNGTYYFSYSTGDTHFIMYATGTSPYGPFTIRGKIGR